MSVVTNQDRLNELFDADPRNDTAIANDLGVSKQSISMWRKGIRSPKKSVLIRIAEKYRVSLEWLMGFDVDKVPEAQLPADTADQPKNDEVRLLVRGLNKMTPEEIERATNIMKLAFEKYADYFEKGNDDDEA